MLKTHDKRPQLNLPFDGLDKALELLGAILLAIFIVTVAASWSNLPDEVPTHFGFNGQPDAWGSRAQILILPGIALVLFLLLTVLARMPHRYNYMVAITAENAERQYRLARRMLLGMKILIVVLFTSLYVGSWAVATGKAPGLPDSSMLLTLLPIGGLLIWYLFSARRAR